MGEKAQLIAATAKQTSQAVSEALKGLKLQPGPSIRLSKFYDKPHKVGDPTINEWLIDIDVYCRQFGLTDDDAKLGILVDYLAGNAREEYLCASETVKKDFKELVKLLRRRFGPGETSSSLSTAFSTRVQLENETLTDYSRALMRLYSRMKAAAPSTEIKDSLIKLRDMSLLEQLKKGVNNEKVLKDLERIEINKPNQSFVDTREEIIRLYRENETGRKARVRQVESDNDFDMPAAAYSAEGRGHASVGNMANDGFALSLLQGQRENSRRLDQLIKLMTKNMAAAYPNVMYPPAFSPPPRQMNPPVNQPFMVGGQGCGRGSCYFCGGMGHYKRDCPLWKARRPDNSNQPPVSPPGNNFYDPTNFQPPSQ